MRFLKLGCLALVAAASMCAGLRADFIVSIDPASIVYNEGANGGTFDVRLTSTAADTLTAYGLRLNATQFVGSVAPITVGSESNLLPGFDIGGAGYSNVTIAAINGAAGANSPNTYGFSATGSFTFAANQSINIARFGFTVGDSTNNAGDGWDTSFLAGNQANPVDTYFGTIASGGDAVAFTSTPGVFRIAAVPEPSTIALLAVAGAGVVGYRWRVRRQKK